MEVTKKNLGTKEEGWAGEHGESFGIYHGCKNGCLTCWARLFKDKRKYKGKKLIDWDDWEKPFPRKSKVKIKKLKSGRYMFPSTHDIYPENMKECLKVCLEIVQAGNDLLITTKGNYEAIKYLTSELVHFKNQIEFRFSIPSIDDKIIKKWEVNAPLFNERLRCLKLAFMMNYSTSISLEPYFDENPDFVIKECHAFLTGDFWVGTMNYLKEISKKCPAVRELGWLYTPNRVVEIKKKLDQIDYATIKYKSPFMAIIKEVG